MLELNQEVPAPFNALNEGTIYLGVANPCAARSRREIFFKNSCKKMEYKAAHGPSARCPGKISPDLRRRAVLFPSSADSMNSSRGMGGAFVNSSYWDSPRANGFGISVRFESPARKFGGRDAHHAPPRHGCNVLSSLRLAGRMADTFHIDGIVYHPIKSCRTVRQDWQTIAER